MTDSDDQFAPVDIHGECQMPPPPPGQPQQPCRYDSERAELMQMLREMRREQRKHSDILAELKAQMAAGSERFKRTEEASTSIGTIRLAIDKEKADRIAAEMSMRADIHSIKEDMREIKSSTGLTSRIVLGACAIVMIAVFGALVSLVVVKGGGHPAPASPSYSE